jgi:hypothetical protein
MLVLQDFEVIMPNLLACTIETGRWRSYCALSEDYGVSETAVHHNHGENQANGFSFSYY